MPTPSPSPPRTSLRPAPLAERGALESLMQLYAYDWSEILPLDVGTDGRFAGAKLDAYWGEEGHHPFLLRVDDTLAGFALIAERSRLTGARGVFDMAEFFVLRRFRRQGVGIAAAFAAFDRFKGPWEVRQRVEATAATAFWQRAVGAYTGGRYEQAAWSAPEWTGPVQRFSTV
jgi:predicted acetyltransferase